MNEFIMMPIPAAMFTAVCALLGGASSAAIATGGAGSPGMPTAPRPVETVTGAAGTASVSSTEGLEKAATETINGAADAGELDTAGWPWSPELHASTKGVTKEGLWRMKVGVSRPDPKPGFPKDAAATGGTGTANAGTASPASAPATGAAATSTAEGEDEDEFAAFRAAADKANGTDAAAAASVPARKWTDADLGALCNQAAVKLGDPAPVKALIGEFVPEGQIPHSRNIPAEERENFAQAVELKAGIEFAG